MAKAKAKRATKAVGKFARDFVKNLPPEAVGGIRVEHAAVLNA